MNRSELGETNDAFFLALSAMVVFMLILTFKMLVDFVIKVLS